MRRTLEAPARAAEPSDAELQAYLTAHGDRFARPPRVRLSQIYLSRARRGAALDADARRLLARLAPDDVARAAALGDPLPVPAHLPLSADADLARLLGPAFARAALALPAGAWLGPIESAYGTHLVWVHARDAGALPALDAVRAQVREALFEERAAAAVAAAVR
jgi:parvulin-like peptidyl-prolyl isomerase